MSGTGFSSAAILALAMGCLLPMTAPAQERVGDVEFSVYPMPGLDARSGEGTRHGYVECRVRLKNTSEEDRTIHLSYPRTRGRQIDHGVVVTRTVRIGGKQEAVVPLYQPPVPVADESLEVRVEGVARSKEIRVPSSHGYGGYSDTTRGAVLLSRSVPRDFPRDESADSAVPLDPALDPQLHVGPGGMGVPGMPSDEGPALFRSELPVRQWSPHWLGYSCYDAILCSEKDVEEMPARVQLAVRRYVECGGMLFIHGRNVPAAFSEHGFADGRGGYYVGMGHVMATLDDNADDWDATYRKLLDARVHIYRPEERPGNLFDLLLAETAIPVRGLFLLIMVFGVAIGPANLWLLSRYKRRIWLWWNVPAISLLTCLLVFGYSMASEGWAGRGKTATLTLLDERCHRATTIGYLSYYCPLTPGGLRFNTDTDVAPLETISAHWRRFRSPWERSAGLCFVDWTHDQHLASGWIKARVPAYFQVRKSEDRRERLSVQPQADGSVKVVNALGADIRRLLLADAAGRVFEGHAIPAGAEKILSEKPGAPPVDPNPAHMRATFTSANWLGRFHEADHTPNLGGSLAPGCYVAYLERSPFIESPLQGVEPEHTAAIVYGILRRHDDGR